MKNLDLIIKEINPDAEFTILGDNVDGITWLNGTTPIADADIEAKATEIETRDAHIRPREKAYPSIKEQLDDIYHNGIDGWKANIKAIKDANPKS